MFIKSNYYLIVDVEATCSNDNSVPREEMEIIEIGAVMQDSRTFEIESEFQTFVRPVRNGISPFCLELTGISADMVAEAPGFAHAVESMKQWISRFADVLFCSWGEYDRRQFLQDCHFHEIAYPFQDGHLNLKEEFSRSLNLRKKLGVVDALTRLGLKFTGSHHRGIDDARNMARIVRRVCSGQ